jgi:hypothetical protein
MIFLKYLPSRRLTAIAALFAGLLCALNLPAQDVDTDNTQDINSLEEGEFRGMTRNYEPHHQNAEGNPFFYRAWLPGEVRLENGSRFRGVELLYDVFEHLIILRKEGSESMHIIDKDMVQSFHLGDNSRANMANFVRKEFLENELTEVEDNQFVQVLYEGDGYLYAINHKELDDDVFSDLQSDYFYVAPNGEVHVLEPRKKAILKTFSDRREELNDYIEGRDLDVSQRDDLVEVVMYYTTAVN